MSMMMAVVRVKMIMMIRIIMMIKIMFMRRRIMVMSMIMITKQVRQVTFTDFLNIKEKVPCVL